MEVYREAMVVCQNVTILVMRLNKRIEKNMTETLKFRLRDVRLVQKWVIAEQTWVWVLEMEKEECKEFTENRQKNAKYHAKGDIVRKSYGEGEDEYDCWLDHEELSIV